MAGAAAQRIRQPQRKESQRTARPRPQLAPQPRALSGARAKLPRGLIAVVACLALLAVGRVSLSFAVVQESLQTNAVIAQERDLAAENAHLGELVAGLSGTDRIHRTAISKLNLEVAENPVFLTVRPSAAREVASR